VSAEGDPALYRNFPALQRFARPRPRVEACELCSTVLGADHQHLIEPVQRTLVCACDACAILFSQQGATKYKRVPRRVRFLPDLRITDGQWDALAIPIGLAFLFRSSPQNRVVAFYPSPAGATESLLSLDTWNDLVAVNPVLRDMEPDVEALLVNRVGQSQGTATHSHYLVPIDACYRLVGVIRTHWRGFSGGSELWQEVGQFFADLNSRADGAVEVSRA
jgi:Family of unknown function (DUF5947)